MLPLSSASLSTGSKSDGQRSPNDTVFLRMDEIPYIHEDRSDNYGENGECGSMNPEFLLKTYTFSLFCCVSDEVLPLKT